MFHTIEFRVLLDGIKGPRDHIGQLDAKGTVSLPLVDEVVSVPQHIVKTYDKDRAVVDVEESCIYWDNPFGPNWVEYDVDRKEEILAIIKRKALEEI